MNTETNYSFLFKGTEFKRKCAFCGKEYIYYSGHVEYKVGRKNFCSYDHKMKYIKKNNIDTRKTYEYR